MPTEPLKSAVESKKKDTEENWIIGGDKIIWEVILEYRGKEQIRYDKCYQV